MHPPAQLANLRRVDRALGGKLPAESITVLDMSTLGAQIDLLRICFVPKAATVRASLGPSSRTASLGNRTAADSITPPVQSTLTSTLGSTLAPKSAEIGDLLESRVDDRGMGGIRGGDLMGCTGGESTSTLALSGRAVTVGTGVDTQSRRSRTSTLGSTALRSLPVAMYGEGRLAAERTVSPSRPRGAACSR